ncbi:hypothetical protein FF011L_17700 [Roseimaritima multifibrata]|uniref:Transmembrane protein n=1 Tax=Roseimaritima multifibrata TaxID=1930274 RepID=A0A517MDQ0_9BACT|nr:hypothetical protein [Roseimaritima multifibrata]QDS93015.1 hypothetical protein FF011L_17700 [Roseimaritima multifibrata]
MTANFESIAQLMERLGPPPQAIMDDWIAQLTAGSSFHEEATDGDFGLRDVATRYAVDRQNRLVRMEDSPQSSASGNLWQSPDAVNESREVVVTTARSPAGRVRANRGRRVARFRRGAIPLAGLGCVGALVGWGIFAKSSGTSGSDVVEKSKPAEKSKPVAQAMPNVLDANARLHSSQGRGDAFSLFKPEPEGFVLGDQGEQELEEIDHDNGDGLAVSGAKPVVSLQGIPERLQPAAMVDAAVEELRQEDYDALPGQEVRTANQADSEAPATGDSPVHPSSPQLEIDPLVFEFYEHDQRKAWHLGTAPPAERTQLGFSFVLPADIDLIWVMPPENDSQRASMFVVQLTSADNREVAIQLRYDLRIAKRLTCRRRLYARLDPQLPWFPLEAPKFSEWMHQQFFQQKQQGILLAAMERRYADADSSTRRQLRPQRDALRQSIEQVESVLERSSQLSHLLDSLAAPASMDLRLQVRSPEKNEILLSSRGADFLPERDLPDGYHVVRFEEEPRDVPRENPK